MNSITFPLRHSFEHVISISLVHAGYTLFVTLYRWFRYRCMLSMKNSCPSTTTYRWRDKNKNPTNQAPRELKTRDVSKLFSRYTRENLVRWKRCSELCFRTSYSQSYEWLERFIHYSNCLLMNRERSSELLISSNIFSNFHLVFYPSLAHCSSRMKFKTIWTIE